MVTCLRRRSVYREWWRCTRRLGIHLDNDCFLLWVRGYNKGGVYCIWNKLACQKERSLCLRLGTNRPHKDHCHSRPFVWCQFAQSFNCSLSLPPPPRLVVPFQLVFDGLYDPHVIWLTSSWGLRGLHLPALLSRCFKGYKHWQFLYFELLPYIKRNHKEYLETCKHWEKQSTFLHPQAS